MKNFTNPHLTKLLPFLDKEDKDDGTYQLKPKEGLLVKVTIQESETLSYILFCEDKYIVGVENDVVDYGYVEELDEEDVKGVDVFKKIFSQ
jgi:hypothetical protein